MGADPETRGGGERERLGLGGASPAAQGSGTQQRGRGSRCPPAPLSTGEAQPHHEIQLKGHFGQANGPLPTAVRFSAASLTGYFQNEARKWRWHRGVFKPVCGSCRHYSASARAACPSQPRRKRRKS